MAKRKVRHEIRFGIPEGRLGKLDAEFDVWRGPEKVGTLFVSQGAIEWRPANAKKYQYHCRWEGFSKVMRRCRKREIPGA